MKSFHAWDFGSREDYNYLSEHVSTGGAMYDIYIYIRVNSPRGGGGINSEQFKVSLVTSGNRRLQRRQCEGHDVTTTMVDASVKDVCRYRRGCLEAWKVLE